MKRSHILFYSVALLSLVLSGMTWAKDVEVKLGPVREETIQFLMKYRHVDRAGAIRMIEQKEREGTKVIDSLKIPAGGLMTYVKINGDGNGKAEVENQGCGLMLSRDSDWGRKFWANMDRMKEKDPKAYQYFMDQVGDATKKGYFVAKLTPDQVEVMGGRKPKQGTKPKPRPKPGSKQQPGNDGIGIRAGAGSTRFLVVACTFPAWTDKAPRKSCNIDDRYNPGSSPWHDTSPYPEDAGTAFQHPIGIASNARFVGNIIGPGGPFVLNGTYQSTDTGCTGTGGRNGPLSQWTEAHAVLDPQTYTTDSAFQNHWFSLIFDTSPNAQSLYNFLFLNSHQQLALSGVLQDVKGWFRNHKHPLDGCLIGDSEPATQYLPFPGTPILTRDDPDAASPLVLKGYSSSATTVAFYFNKTPLPAITVTKEKADGTGFEALGTDVKPFTDNNRRVVGFYNFSIPIADTASTAGVENRIRATFGSAVCPVGTPGRVDDTTIQWNNPRGQSMVNLFNGTGFPENQLIVQQADVVQPRGNNPSSAHWIKSFDYYNHDHIWYGDGSNTTYQLAHLQSNSTPAGGYLVDDLAGSAEHLADRRDRPFPYNIDGSDLNRPNGGVFSQSAGHDSAAWISDVNKILDANGFDATNRAGYDRILYIIPGAGAGDEATRVGSFIPVARGGTVVLPENAGLGLVAHEIMHTYGAADLYDTDLYYNAGGCQPTRSQADGGLKNYSVMANGMRVDPFTKILCGWLPSLVTPTSDQLQARFPSIEDSGTNPVVYKLPVKLPPNVGVAPALPAGTSPVGNEYFLVENHNQNLFGDGTSKGLTIWHVDERAVSADSAGSGGCADKGMGDGNFLRIIPIQADDLSQIEQGGNGDEGDPFPGSTNNRNWYNLSKPSSRSRGICDALSFQPIPGTDFDTYLRLLNIKVEGDTNVPPTQTNGAVIIADLYVQPKEVVVTGTDMAPTTVDQGATNKAFENLTFTNYSTADTTPDGSPGISTGSVTINAITFQQNGTAPTGTDLTRIAVFDDSNGIAGFQPIDPDGPGPQQPDTLIQQVSNPFASGKSVKVSGLNYLVQLGASKARNMFVAYDVSDTAQTNPAISVGSMVQLYTDVEAQAPGVVRQGKRGNDGFFVDSDFPITSSKATIIASTDTLTVTPNYAAPFKPTTVAQGTVRQPMVQLDLTVNRDDIRIKDLKIDQTGSDTNPSDVVKTELWLESDAQAGLDTSAGKDTLLKAASFNLVTGKIQATFSDLNYLVTAGAPQTLYITYTISEDAQVPNQTVSLSLSDESYVTLVPETNGSQDAVAPTNFPIDTGGTLITRKSHELVVKGRDIAPAFADPDADPNTVLTRLIPMQKLVLSAAAGTVTVNGIKMDQTGSAALSDVYAGNGVRIYEDVNTNDKIDAGTDTLIGQGDLSLVGSVLTATIALDENLGTPAIDSFRITAGTTREVIIAFDCDDAAVVSKTLKTHLQADYIDLSQTGFLPTEQDYVTLKDQLDTVVTALDSPSVVIRGFLKITNTPANSPVVVIGSKKFPMQNLKFEAISNPADVGDLIDQVILNSLKLNKFGSSTASGDISKIALYVNNAEDVTFDGTETLLAEKDNTAAGWPSSVTFGDVTKLNKIIISGTPLNILVTIDVPTTATPGVTVGTQVLNGGFVNSSESPNGVVIGSTVFPLSSTTTNTTIGGPIVLSTSSVTARVYKVTFSGDMLPGTGNAGVEKVANWTFESPTGTPQVVSSVVYDVPSRTATVTLANAQTPGNTYHALVNIAVTDTAGRRIRDEIIKDYVNPNRQGNEIFGTVGPAGAFSDQPDLLIKQNSELDTAFAINDTYQVTASGNQIEALSVNPGLTATYNVKIQNDGSNTRTFLLTASAATGGGWTFDYKVGGVSKYTEFTTTGYTTGTLAPAASEIVTIEAKPDFTVTPATSKTATITAVLSGTDLTVQDAVDAVTTVNQFEQPDLLVKLTSELDAAYAINGSTADATGYQTVPSGNQIETQLVDPTVTANYQVKIENDGNTTRTFVVKALTGTSGGGWTFDYKVGGNSKYAAITGAGYTTGSLAPGASEIIDVSVTPDNTVIANLTRTTTITADLNGSTVLDAVKISTSTNPPPVNFTAASQSSVGESGTMTITAQLAAVSALDVSVPYTITGTATNGTDYTITASPIVITAGLTTGTTTITITSDLLDELNETVIVTMGTPVNATAGTTTVHTATITDDDLPPTVDFTAASQSSVAESGTMTVTAQLSAQSGLDVSLPYTVTGTASNGTDYTITSSPITIAAGNTTGTITITILTDTLDEADETAIVTMDTPINATKGTTSAHTATITDDDQPPDVQFTSASQQSPNETGTMTVTAQLSTASGRDIQVPFTMTGTAINGTDYTITASPITIVAGLTTGTITITITPDALFELDETVIVTMGNPVNATQGATTVHTAIINNDDNPPVVNFTSASQSSVAESGTMTVTAQLSAVSGLDVTIPFTLTGTAKDGTDYTMTASPLVIPAGQTTGSLTITITSDALDEADETVIATMGTITYGTPGTTTVHTATITDDDPLPSVAFTSASQASAAETGTLTVTAQLSVVSGRDVTVPFTLGGTAANGTDYTITASPITILEGQTSAAITITITSDLIYETNETVLVTMGTPVNATKGNITAHTATITDDDAMPTVQFTSASQAGSEASGTLTVTAQQTAISAFDTTIPFTLSGTATSGTDYTVPGSTMTVPAGQTTGTLTITVINDTIDELDETAIVTMGTPVNAIKGATAEHTATITDDDNPPTVQFSLAQQTSITESGTLAVQIELSTVSGLDVTVPFTLSGTATEGADYVISASPVTIPAGQTSTFALISIVDDALGELPETVVLTIGNPINATQGQTLVHTATITDNDPPNVRFTTDSQKSISENGTMPITVELSKPYNLNVTVPFTVTGSATSGTDFTITASPVTIPAGQTTGTITILILPDSNDEPNETVIVTMETPTNGNKGTTTVHTATITDDDLPTVQFTSATQTSTGETGTMTVTAQLSAASEVDATVPFTVSGTARNGTDYSISASPIKIPAGQTTGTATISIVEDALDELNETVVLTMGTPVNAVRGTTSVHTATVTDDDAAPTVQLTSASQTSVSETGTMTIGVQLSAASGLDVTVPFAVSGTATKNGDFTITNSPVVIPAGSTDGTIQIAIIEDANDEPNETVVVSIGSPVNATLGTTTVHTATITDDDIVQPDLLIKRLIDPDSSYGIDNEYQPTPSGAQVKAQTINPKEKATFLVRVQNDGNVNRSYLMKAKGNDVAGWTLTYTASGVDVTADITGSGYTTPALVPTDSQTITIDMTPTNKALGGKEKTTVLSVFTDSADLTVDDAVQAGATLSEVHQPDAQIKQESELDSAYAFNGEPYAQDGKPSGDQIEIQNGFPGARSAFNVVIENDGNTVRSFRAYATESAEQGWTVKYIWSPENITSSIVSAGGWETPILDPGTSLILTIEMTPPADAVSGATKTTTLVVESNGGGKDAVSASIRVSPGGKPDAQIKRCTESDSEYGGDNLYQSTPSGAQIEQNVAFTSLERSACYSVKIQNDDTATRTCFAKASETGDSGWTVTYRVGSTDISSQMRGSGYTTQSLAAGASEVITVEMTPAQSVAEGSNRTATIQVYFDRLDGIIRDAVQAVAEARSAPPLTVTGITPNSGVNTGSVSNVSIAGIGFVSGATVKLTMSGQTDVTATNVQAVSTNQITCNFDLTGKTPGAWNVVVTNPDQQQGSLPNGFTITGPVHDVAVTAFSASPNPVKRRQTATFSYTVKNVGTETEKNLTFRLTYNGSVLGKPVTIATLSPGQETTGTIKLRISSTVRKGDYLITGEVVAVSGETDVTNNKATVKVTVQ